jgi:DNA-binding IclR family transcriptional regulator
MRAEDGELTSKHQPLLVLSKITEILDAFSLSRPSMTLGEIQQATGLPTSTVQRLVSNLVAQEFLDRSGDQIRIGVKMAFWAATATKGLDVLAVVTPVLKEIRDATGETASFFRVEQGYRVCVAIAETEHALRRNMYVGKIVPLPAGSAGRVLLAWNPELTEQVLAGPIEPMTEGTVTDTAVLRELIHQARADGYAITAGEREDSASGLAAPVFDWCPRDQRADAPDAARTVREVGGSARRQRREGHPDAGWPLPVMSCAAIARPASCMATASVATKTPANRDP